jgi:hypothetical protein
MRVVDAMPSTETITEHTLTFRTSDESELTNVLLAVQSLDGAVILPGEIFSYNATVGERSEDRGFRAGLMYVNGQVVSGIGGGVCIPSTALYNAALNAGLEIVERYNHSGPVSYAEPGLDAAVVFGLKDLRFRNNTKDPIAIHAGVLGNALTVTLQGRRVLGRRIVVEAVDLSRLGFTEEKALDETVPEGQPEVEQEGRPGYIVTVVRTVYQGDRVVSRETVSHDVVAARNRIVKINPLDDPTSPEALARAKEEAATAAAQQAAEKPEAEEAASETPAVTETPGENAEKPADPVRPEVLTKKESAPKKATETPTAPAEPKAAENRKPEASKSVKPSDARPEAPKAASLKVTPPKADQAKPEAPRPAVKVELPKAEPRSYSQYPMWPRQM